MCVQKQFQEECRYFSTRIDFPRNNFGVAYHVLD